MENASPCSTMGTEKTVKISAECIYVVSKNTRLIDKLKFEPPNINHFIKKPGRARLFNEKW